MLEKCVTRTALVFAFLASAYLLWLTPYNPDEIIQYRTLACMEGKNPPPFAYTRCEDLYLNFYGHQLPIPMAHYYVGASQALIYYPIKILFPTPVSHRIFGFAYLFVFALLASKLVQFSFQLTLALSFLFFPFLIQFMQDIGPQNMGVISTLLLPYLLIRSQKLIFPILAGLTAFFSAESKGFFLVFLPAILMLTVTLWRINPLIRLVQLIKNIVIAALIFSVLYFIYLNLLRFNGETFLHYISALSNGRIFDLSLQYSALKSSLRPFFTDFVNFAHYAFHLNKLDDYPAYKAQKIGELSFLTFCYWFIFISLVIATHNLNKSYQRFAPGFIAAILLSLWGLCIPTASWAGHHVIYVIPFIFIWTLFSLRKIYEYRPTLGTLYFATLCVLGISPLFTLSKYEPLAEFNSSNRRVLEFINESGLSKTAFIFSPNWGFFDFPFIYGSPETRIADFDIGFSDQNHQLYRNMINGTEKARQEAIILKRSLLLVSLEGKEQSFNSFFPREAYPDFVRIQVPGVKDEGYRWALWLLKDPAQAKIDQKKINKRLL